MLVSWRHMSTLQVISIYLCFLYLLLVRFAKAFGFSASSSSFLKIHEKKNPRVKESAVGIWTTDPWHFNLMLIPLDHDTSLEKPFYNMGYLLRRMQKREMKIIILPNHGLTIFLVEGFIQWVIQVNVWGQTKK